MSWTKKIENRSKTLNDFFIEIFDNRFLFLEIIKKDAKITFAQSALGPLYFVILPFMQALIFNFLLSNIAKVNLSENIPSYLFFLSGFIFWNYFSTSANRGSAGIVQNIKLIQQISIPSSVFLISPIIFSLISFFVTLFLFIIFNILYALNSEYVFNLNFNYILILPLLVYTIILSLTYGLLVSALSIKFRDIIYGNQLIFQILMFGSCVLYSSNQLMKMNLEWVLYINPFILVIEIFRWICFGSKFILQLQHILSQVLILIIFFLLGLKLFLKNEKYLVDLT